MQEVYKNKEEYLKNAVAKVVSRLRSQKDVSCNKLGDEYELDDTTIGRIEKGRVNVKLVTLWRLAEALDIDMLELVKLIKAELPPGFKLMDE